MKDSAASSKGLRIVAASPVAHIEAIIKQARKLRCKARSNNRKEPNDEEDYEQDDFDHNRVVTVGDDRNDKV